MRQSSEPNARQLFNQCLRPPVVTHSLYGTTVEIANDDDSAYPEQPEADLEALLGQKSKLLGAKLNVLAAEIHDRLFFWDRNLTRIRENQDHANDSLSRLARLTNYQLREPRDLAPFYQQRFRLEQERRDQDVNCWRDLVPVIRDFLYVWEAHEQARARSIFLKHAGSGTT